MDMLLSCPSSISSSTRPCSQEMSKASPVSLCENQNPSPPPEDNPNTTKLTLGQTLRNELRKSSIRIHNHQKNEDNVLLIDCEEEQEEEEDRSIGHQPIVDAAAASSLDFTVGLPVNGVMGRRRRPRRNPVWLYFQVEEGLASCKHCDYKTKSIFSTNLKVHLKSHHRRLFDQVLEAEEVMAAATENAAQAMKALKQNSEDIFPAVRRPHYPAEEPQEVYELQQKLLNSTSPLGQSSRTGEQQTAVHNSSGNSYLSAALANSNAPFSSMKALTDMLSNPLPSALEEVCNSQHPLSLSIQSALASLSTEWPGHSATNPTPSMPINEQQNLAEKFKQKRKRLRRHPVWTFFIDFEDKIVGCVMCNFRTTSAFSTNLKMHLRAHHKQEYLQVMEAELEQCVDGGGRGEEGVMGTVNVDTYSHSLQTVSARTGRIKRKRKTAEELQMIIEKCKSNMEREKEKRSMLMATSRSSHKTSRKSSLPDFTCSTAIMPAPSPNTFSATDQLNAMIAGMLSNKDSNSTSSSTNQMASFPQPVHNTSANSGNGNNSPSASQKDEQEDLKEFLNHLNEVPENESTRELLTALRKQARDFAFSKLAQTVGSLEVLNSPAFQLFVYALAPDYDLVKLDEINRQQQLLANKINQ